jgi:hypothetical protein
MGSWFLHGFSYFNGLQMQLTQLFGHGKNMNTNSMNEIMNRIVNKMNKLGLIQESIIVVVDLLNF